MPSSSPMAASCSPVRRPSWKRATTRSSASSSRASRMVRSRSTPRRARRRRHDAPAVDGDLLMPFVAATRSLGRAGLFSLSVFRASKPTPDFFKELIREIYKIGARSLPIIAVGGAFVGLSVTLLGYRSLETYGATAQVSALLGLGMYRELGPVLTALLFIGRAGSSIAAELGLMRATDQITALGQIGTS